MKIINELHAERFTKLNGDKKGVVVWFLTGLELQLPESLIYVAYFDLARKTFLSHNAVYSGMAHTYEIQQELC